MAGVRDLLATALAVMVGLQLVGCGNDDGGGPTAESIAGEYSATFSYFVAAGDPVSLSDSRSCGGAISIDSHVDREFSGQFSIVDDTCLLSPDAGAFTGTIEDGTMVSVVGLYTTVVEFDLYDCGLVEGGTAMSGTHTGDAFTVEASAVFTCVASGFDPVDVATELTVTAVQD